MKSFFFGVCGICVSILLVACSGGDNGGNIQLQSAAKGPFVVNSKVVVYRLNNNGSRSDRDLAKGKVISRDGKYFLENVSWNGFSEIEITGKYFNEYSGRINDEISLTAVFPTEYRIADIMNINVLTHFVAKRTTRLMRRGVKAYDAKSQALREIMIGFFDMNVDPRYLNPIDNTGKYAEQNAELLRISAAISSKPELLNELTKAFMDDGKINKEDNDEFAAFIDFDRAIRSVDPEKCISILLDHGFIDSSSSLKEWLPKPLDSLTYLQKYSVGGTVSNLRGKLILKNSDGEQIEIRRRDGHVFNGSFKFHHTFISGKQYAVSVVEAPERQDCDVSYASDTINEHNVSNIKVICRPKSYRVGGTLDGSNGSVRLELISGNTEPRQTLETLEVEEDGNFVFASHPELTSGTRVGIRVKQNPTEQVCSVSNDEYIDDADYMLFRIYCRMKDYHIKGEAHNIIAPITLNVTHLENNAVWNVFVEQNGYFDLIDRAHSGETYNVSILNSYERWRQCTLSQEHFVVQGDIDNLKLICQNKKFSVKVHVNNLYNEVNEMLKLRLNNGGLLVVKGSGDFTFDENSTYNYNDYYKVSIVEQPLHHSCNLINNPQGYIPDHNISVIVDCIAKKYPIKIKVASDSDNISSLNRIPGGEDFKYIVKLKSTSRSVDMAKFTSGVTLGTMGYGKPYTAEIQSIPEWTECSLENASDIITETNEVTLKCKNKQYGVQLNLQGFDSQLGELNVSINPQIPNSLHLSRNGEYHFDANLTYGQMYRLTIESIPSGMQCHFFNHLNISNGMCLGKTIRDTIICKTDYYTLGGLIKTILRDSITLKNESNNKQFVISRQNDFIIEPRVKYGYEYNLTVAKQPQGQTCHLTNAIGTVKENIFSTEIFCYDNNYTVGGNIRGMYQGAELGLVLQARKDLSNSNGHVQAITLTQNGEYRFKKDGNISTDANMVLIMNKEPEGQNCSLNTRIFRQYIDSGSIAIFLNEKMYASIGHYYWDVSKFPSHDLVDFNITCQNKLYHVGGNASSAFMIVDYDDNVTLVLNNKQISVRSGSSFNFPDMEYGSNYNVEVMAKPSYVNCWVENAQGIVHGNINNLYLKCKKNSYRLGGNIQGLQGEIVFKEYIYGNNGTESNTIILGQEGDFYFDDNVSFVHNNRYQVEILRQPDNQMCQFENNNTNIAGMFDDSNITDINITCESTLRP